MISPEEAKTFREQFKPAFAGYVTDGNISDRDVLATLMDLIARGYVGLDADTQKTPVKIKRIYKVGNVQSLLPFESFFIEKLFQDSSELTPEGVRQKFASKELHDIISANLNSLSQAKIVRSLLLVDDSQGNLKAAQNFSSSKMARFAGLFFKSEGPFRDTLEPPSTHEITTVGELQKYINLESITALLFGFLFFYIVGILLMATSDELPSASAVELIGLLLVSAFYVAILFIPLWYSVQKIRFLMRMRSLLVFQFENNIVPFTKYAFEQLFDFIKSMPLKKQRVFNEFMPYAVAFGLDTSWNESFGIQVELPVASQTLGEFSKETGKSINDWILDEAESNEKYLDGRLRGAVVGFLVMFIMFSIIFAYAVQAREQAKVSKIYWDNQKAEWQRQSEVRAQELEDMRNDAIAQCNKLKSLNLSEEELQQNPFYSYYCNSSNFENQFINDSFLDRYRIS